MKTCRLLFLGAGFSHLAGLPLGPQLLPEVRKRIVSQYGGENHVERDLKRYITYLRSCFDRAVSPEEVDCEEFLGFLDVEHYLGLKGKDTWSSEGNESQLMIRTAIAQVIHSRTPCSASDIPDAYRHFVKKLTATDCLLTFNYDTLLENALELEHVRYRLFPQRYSAVHTFSCTVDPLAPDEIVLIKLHGSVDWFSRQHFEEESELVRSAPHMYPAGYRPNHPLFGHDAITTPMPLTEGGPRPENDSLRMLYRVRELASVLNQPFWKCSPFILSPSNVKLFYAAPLRDFWRGLQHTGGLNLSLGIVGYSLPKYDDYALQAMYHICRNYLYFEPELELGGRRKTKIRIIDYRKTDQDVRLFRQRYQFLDWNRTEAWFEGFSQDAVDWLLR